MLSGYCWMSRQTDNPVPEALFIHAVYNALYVCAFENRNRTSPSVHNF